MVNLIMFVEFIVNLKAKSRPYFIIIYYNLKSKYIFFSIIFCLLYPTDQSA